MADALGSTIAAGVLVGVLMLAGAPLSPSSLMLAATATWLLCRFRVAVAGHLRRFLFHEDHPLNLAWARIVVFFLLAWRFDTAGLVAMSQLPDELVAPATGSAWLVALLPRQATTIAAVAHLLRASAICACIGFATPASAAVAAASAFLTFGAQNQYGIVGHTQQHLVWFATLLAVSPSGDRLSVDALIRRWRTKLPPPEERATGYGFPRRCMFLLLGLAYFGAGFWKLAGGGVEWFLSDNLATWAIKFHHTGVGQDVSVIEAVRPFLPLGALLTLMFEMGFIVAMFSWWGRALIVPIAIAFHNTTKLFFNIGFETLWYTYLIFVDFDWVRRVIGIAPRPSATRSTARPKVPAKTVTRLSCFVGLVLLAGEAVFAVGGVVAGWPFASYPQFEHVQTPLFTDFVIEGHESSGAVQRLVNFQGATVVSPLWYYMLLITQEHPAGLEVISEQRARRLRALCTFVWQHHPALRNSQRVSFVLEDYDLSPQAGYNRLIGRRELFDCARPAGSLSEEPLPPHTAASPATS